MENLIPLKIPSGWALTYNQFVDEPAQINENGSIENWDAYKESLLQIQRLDLKDGAHYIPETTLLIDLGWTPEATASGAFKLALVIKNPNNDMDWEPISEFNSQDRYEIQAKIEEWLYKLSVRYSRDMPPKQIAKMLTFEI